MTQLSMLEMLDATLDLHFPLARPKTRSLAQARQDLSDVEAPVHLDDFERYGPLPERVDPQTGVVEER